MINIFDGDYAFLSNFYESPFEYQGIVFPTMEHWFQAWKTKDPEEFAAIVAAGTPGKAKRLGRHCTLRTDWEQVKTDVMMNGLHLKFQNPVLMDKLLATGDKVLIEGNTWHDQTWGCCFCEKCGGQGKNLLGQLLMELRDEILNKEIDI